MQKTDAPAPVGATATEALREELCSMEQREAESAHRLEALRSAVQLGASDIAAGRFKSFDTKASLRDYLRSPNHRAP
jgi:antitoxin ParD1/3/4